MYSFPFTLWAKSLQKSCVTNNTSSRDLSDVTMLQSLCESLRPKCGLIPRSLCLIRSHVMLNWLNLFFNSYILQKFTFPVKAIKKFPEIEFPPRYIKENKLISMIMSSANIHCFKIAWTKSPLLFLTSTHP